MKTPEEILEDVKSRLLMSTAIETLLAEAYEMGYIDRWFAELDKRRAHLDKLDAAPEKPELSRFLPRRPDDVPMDWAGVEVSADGTENTAIRWGAPSDVWHFFGLLAPSEGGGWIPHRPGDPMPCDENMEVDYIFAKQMARFLTAHAYNCRWSKANDNDIIGWRPALAEVQS